MLDAQVSTYIGFRRPQIAKFHRPSETPPCQADLAAIHVLYSEGRFCFHSLRSGAYELNPGQAIFTNPAKVNVEDDHRVINPLL